MTSYHAARTSSGLTESSDVILATFGRVSGSPRSGPRRRVVVARLHEEPRADGVERGLHAANVIGVGMGHEHQIDGAVDQVLEPCFLSSVGDRSGHCLAQDVLVRQVRRRA